MSEGLPEHSEFLRSNALHIVKKNVSGDLQCIKVYKSVVYSVPKVGRDLQCLKVEHGGFT